MYPFGHIIAGGLEMSRVKSVLSAGLLGATLALAGIGGASADPVMQPNDNNGNGPKTDNCIGVHSAMWTGNGVVVREQAKSGQRSELVHEFLGESCGEPE